MKVAISIPDPVFEAADRLAAERSIPRSQLYSEALQAYLAEHGPQAVRSRLDAVYSVQEGALDERLNRAQLDIIPREDW